MMAISGRSSPPPRLLWSRALFITLLMTLLLSGPSCDDPVPGPIGGVVFVIRTFVSQPDSKFAEAKRVQIDFNRVVVVHRDSADAETEQTVIDTQPRTVVLNNANRDVFVAQWQVPVGQLEQIRIFPTKVTLVLLDDTEIELSPETSDLPSWRNTGWKVGPTGEPFAIEVDKLTGIRGLFDWNERLVRQGHGGKEPQGKSGHTGWKIKPTMPAEQFDPNPADGAPGVLIDHITFVPKPGVTRADVEALMATVGASVVIAPELSRWYRVKLPVSLDLQSAFFLFRALPQTEFVLPAVNYGLETAPNEGSQPNQDFATIPVGWDHAQSRDPDGLVGSHVVRVGVADNAIDVTHPDLRRNIGINQGELPRSLFVETNGIDGLQYGEIEPFDCDPPGIPDGVISIRDMECNDAIKPPDSNGNEVVDAQDIAHDDTDCEMGCWKDGVDDDDFDGNPLTFRDDIVGWNFARDDNDPSRVLNVALNSKGAHGTEVAGIIGAEGNNALGVAGVNWRVSIVPLTIHIDSEDPFREPYAPHEKLAEMFVYVEHLGNRIDVVNMSQGLVFERDGAERKCATGPFDPNRTKIPEGDFALGVTAYTAAFADLFVDAGQTLYVLGAGNKAYDIGEESVFSLPFEPMRDNLAVRDRVLSVGAAETVDNKANFSAYGGGVTLFAPGVSWRVLIPQDLTCTEFFDQDTGEVKCPTDCAFEGSQILCDGASGTSLAAPTAAGAAGLLAAVDPAMRGNPEGLRTALINTSLPVVFPDCSGVPVPSAGVLQVGALLAPP